MVPNECWFYRIIPLVIEVLLIGCFCKLILMINAKLRQIQNPVYSKTHSLFTKYIFVLLRIHLIVCISNKLINSCFVCLGHNYLNYVNDNQVLYLVLFTGMYIEDYMLSLPILLQVFELVTLIYIMHS
mmetsp:Transcript_2638/g.4403  ORF Transcript_2638/g.4403 Transcript_2638/m.4403 type:complete len:128 (+) Transcript_2638:145-528(+)